MVWELYKMGDMFDEGETLTQELTTPNPKKRPSTSKIDQLEAPSAKKSKTVTEQPYVKPPR